MNSFKRIAFVLLTVFLAAGCSSDMDNDPRVFDVEPGDTQKNTPVFPTDLTGLEPLNLINTKYDRFDLNCKLWTQKGLGLNTNVTPNDEFTWKVSEIYNQSAQLVLQSVLPNYQVDVEIQIDEIFHLNDHKVKTTDDTLYNFSHTPEVLLVYQYSGKTFKGNQVTIDSQHEGRLPILEKVNYQVVDQSHKTADDNNVKYLSQVDCVILSEIKTPYQQQFQKTQSN